MSFNLSIEKNSRNQDSVFVINGMSTEICFAKMISAKRNLVYYGWKVGATLVYPNIVEDSLDYISNQILQLDWTGCNGAMFNPGFCSVPYICTTANLVYFPSQILVGFNKFEDIVVAVKTANSKGIKCYAVAGYDGCIPNCIVAWIKFIDIPTHYLKVMEKTGICSCLSLCVYDKENKVLGENCARLAYREHPQSIEDIYPNDIYLLYIHEGYGQPQEVDNEIFKTLLTDIKSEDIYRLGSMPKARYISDWESGMDTVPREPSSSEHDSIKKYVITVKDSLILYQLATAIAISFVQLNAIKVKGLVLNPYFISDPSYELNYGYIPLLYWQGNPENESLISNLLKKVSISSSNNLKLHYNIFHSQKLINLSFNIEKVVENSSPLCIESGDWISLFKPTEYNFKFLSFQSLINEIQKFIA